MNSVLHLVTINSTLHFNAYCLTELQKELKRKQYAQKAKNKLDAYYSKVKTEAEKIQELKNLGIDPSSLF